jgi:hypothetical protein
VDLAATRVTVDAAAVRVEWSDGGEPTVIDLDAIKWGPRA